MTLCNQYVYATDHQLIKKMPRYLWVSTSLIICPDITIEGWYGLLVFRDIKMDSVLKGLKNISYYLAHRAIISMSLLRSSAASVGSSTTIYRLVSSGKRRIFEPISFTMSFMYSKNNKDQRMEACGTPAFKEFQYDLTTEKVTRCFLLLR